MQTIGSIGLLALIAGLALSTTPLQAQTFGDYAGETTDVLIHDFPGRYRGTDSFVGAANWMFERLSPGYTTYRQDFSWWDGDVRSAQNVVAEGKGVTGKTLVVGAHFDTDFGKPTLQGLDDNASGAGVLTEIARNLSGLDFEDGVNFVAFGAEEEGLVGSYFYVDSLDAAARENLTGMINIDSLITGDKMYVGAGYGSVADPKLASLSQHALRIAKELGIDVSENPGRNPDYPAGTGCCSDGEWFDMLGVPTVFTEATDWDLPPYDGYTQTSDPDIPGGETWHNPALDNETVLTTAFGDRIEERLRDFSRLLTRLVLEATNTDLRYSVASGAVLWRGMEDQLVRQHQTIRAMNERRFLDLTMAPQTTGQFDGIIGATGAFSSADGDPAQAGFYAIGGYQANDWLNLGGSLAYNRDTAENGHDGDIDSDTWNIGLNAYARDTGPFWLSGELSAGYARLNLDRSVFIKGKAGPVLLDQTLSGKTDAAYRGGAVDGGYDFSVGTLLTGPTFGAGYARYDIDGFSERNSLRTALTYDSSHFETIPLNLGWRAVGDIELSNGMPLRLQGRVSWVWDLGSKALNFQAVTHADRAVRTATIAARDDSFGLLQLGAQLGVSETIDIFANASGTVFHDDGNEAAYRLGVQWRF